MKSIKEQMLEKDARYISPSYTRDYPFIVAGGRGCKIMDTEGNEYLDFTAGIATTSTGHCHPKVVRAIQRQAERLIHMSGTDFHYEVQIHLAERLASMPKDMHPKQVYFGNSGAEAVEAAIKLIRNETGKSTFIAFLGAFHGRTLGAMSLSASKSIQKRHAHPMGLSVIHAPYPDCRRCPLGHKNPTSCGIACVEYIREIIFGKLIDPSDVAGIVLEPIQGEGGYIVPPGNGWYSALMNLAFEHRLRVIVDEIQTGIGRTGYNFAHEYFAWNNIHRGPDVITSAKGLASGMPISATIARRSIMESWKPGQHASTFGGNPISCAAALATLDVIKEEQLVENAARRGIDINERSLDLEHKYTIVDNSRGLGLMKAIDIVDRDGNPDPKMRDKILHAAFRRKLLLLGCGKSGIRFCPALVVTQEEVGRCFEILNGIIKRFA